MKKILTIACMTVILAATSCKAQDNIQLPKQSMDNNVMLMQSLQNRHSSREYADKDIPDDLQSTVLWAACVINQPESGRLQLRRLSTHRTLSCTLSARMVHTDMSLKTTNWLK